MRLVFFILFHFIYIFPALGYLQGTLQSFVMGPGRVIRPCFIRTCMYTGAVAVGKVPSGAGGTRRVYMVVGGWAVKRDKKRKKKDG